MKTKAAKENGGGVKMAISASENIMAKASANGGGGALAQHERPA
jgi:hypothetical protein